MCQAARGAHDGRAPRGARELKPSNGRKRTWQNGRAPRGARELKRRSEGESIKNERRAPRGARELKLKGVRVVSAGCDVVLREGHVN